MRYFFEYGLLLSFGVGRGRFMSIDTFSFLLEDEECPLERNLFPSRLKDNKRSKQKTITVMNHRHLKGLLLYC